MAIDPPTSTAPLDGYEPVERELLRIQADLHRVYKAVESFGEDDLAELVGMSVNDLDEPIQYCRDADPITGSTD